MSTTAAGSSYHALQQTNFLGNSNTLHLSCLKLKYKPKILTKEFISFHLWILQIKTCLQLKIGATKQMYSSVYWLTSPVPQFTSFTSINRSNHVPPKVSTASAKNHALAYCSIPFWEHRLHNSCHMKLNKLIHIHAAKHTNHCLIYGG
jgi:hypothetical protein